MKKFQVILALVLVLALFCTLFAACAKTSDSGTDQPADQTETNSTAAETGEEETAPVDTENEDEEEPVDVVFYMWDMRGTGNDYGDGVKEAVQKRALELINVNVELNFVMSGDWSTKVVVALSGGERIDVMSLPMRYSVALLYPQGLLTDISDLLPEYAPGAMELVADYIGTYTYNGGIYGLPTLRNYSKNGYLLFNKPLLEEMGLVEQAEAVDSWSDYEEILKAIYEEHTLKGDGMYATRGATGDWVCNNYTCTGDSFDDYVLFDNLGDSLSVVYTDMEGNVSLYQEQEGWVYEASKMADWLEKGYVWPDSSFTTEFADDCMKNQLVATIISGSEYGVDVVKTSTYGFECLAVETVTGMVKTSQPVSWGIGVPNTAEEPEAAVKFIELLYTDKEMINYLNRGIEGVDYDVVDNQAQYKDGLEHYMGVEFVLGNNLLLLPLYGNGADFFDKVAEINATAVKSPYMGFSLDTTGLDLVMGQISAVNDQYLQTMQGGGYTPELYSEYVQKLKDAEVQTYLDEVQKQLDAWLAANET